MGIFGKKKIRVTEPHVKPTPPDEANSTSTWTEPVAEEATPPEGYEVCAGFQPCLTCSHGPVSLFRSSKSPIRFICRACGEVTSTLRLKRDGIILDGKAAVRAVTREQWLELVNDEPVGAFDIRKIEATRPDGYVEDPHDIQDIGQIWDDLFVIYIPTDLVELSAEVSVMERDRTAFFEKGLALKDKEPEDIAFVIKCVSEVIRSNFAFQYGAMIALKEVKDQLGLEQITPIPVSTPRKRAAAKTQRTKVKAAKVQTASDMISEFMDESGFDSQADMLTEFRKNRKPKSPKDDDEDE